MNMKSNSSNYINFFSDVENECNVNRVIEKSSIPKTGLIYTGTPPPDSIPRYPGTQPVPAAVNTSDNAADLQPLATLSNFSATIV